MNIWHIESWRARIIHNEIYGLFLSFSFQDSRLNDPANRVVIVYNVVPVLLLVEVVIREFSFWLFYIKMSSPNKRRSSLFPLAWWCHCVAISLGTGSLFGKTVKKSRGEKSDVNQTCHQSVFSPTGACIRIRCTASAVCLQALTLFLPPLRDFFTLSPNREPAHRLRCYNDNRGALSYGVRLVLFSRRCLQSRFLTSLRHL